MKLFVIGICLAVSVSIGYANYDYEFYNKYNEWNQVPSSNGYDYNDYNTFSSTPEEPSFLKRVGKAILGWGTSTVPGRRSGVLERMRNSISTGVSRVSRQLNLGDGALMPVIMAVGLIIAKGLMDLATATSAQGPKGDRGADGAPGPQGEAAANLFCNGPLPACITGSPTCAAAGNGIVTCTTNGPDCSRSSLSEIRNPLTGAITFEVLPGAQDACTCNAAGAVQLCNRPSCTAVAAPTCPNTPNANAICAGYDSSIVAPVPVCSTLLTISPGAAPLDHLNVAIPNLPNPNNCAAVGGAVPNCPVIPAPACANGNANCANGVITCDNRGGLAPVCSVTPGVGNIPGLSLCTAAPANQLNTCPSCNAAGNVNCAAGNAVCTNYHSSSEIIPAPRCTTNPAPAQNGNTQCSSGTPSCQPLAAPTCNAGNAVCAIGTFTCTGQAPGDRPVCSLVAGVAALTLANACTQGAAGSVKFLCAEVSNPVFPTCVAAGAQPVCPVGTTLTCDAASGVTAGTIPVCSWINGAALPTAGNVNAATCDGNAAVRVCTTAP